MPDKLTFHYAQNTFAFASVSELRDALLASYPGAAYLGSPIVLIHRDEPAPAWGWLVDLLRTRTDWWPALGVAIQHAAKDGGDQARVALADFLDTYQDSLVLLEWTEPTAREFPDPVAGLRGTTFGAPDHRLATIVAGQRKVWDILSQAEIEIDGLAAAEVKSAADLEALLEASVALGNPEGKGPWAWLTAELMFHPELHAWLPQAFKNVVVRDTEARAMLDWFSEQHDLWRHVDLLAAWEATPPTWWAAPIDSKPPKWRFAMRTFTSSAKTLGEVVQAVLGRGRTQAQTRPVADLAPIYGGRPA